MARSPIPILLVAALVAGCADHTNSGLAPGGFTSQDHILVMDPNDPAAGGSVHGEVHGLAPGSPPLAGIVVEVLAPVASGQVGDTVATQYEVRGSVTTDAAGHFALSNVAAGAYILYANRVIPQGSSWDRSPAIPVTSDGETVQTVDVGLSPVGVLPDSE